ncbi:MULTISPECIES: O-antigen ligase family protein [unclassified Rhizobium]|uniref:O-antigen ligase family protein n=1 Tax=unclassified Rhizobium TaxID=2613769 RepID=UPI00115C5371|nr:MULTISPECIES: O-antigen ligase family protein [unclassified Rhizobium]TQX89570.1 O-antigen ligase family protein [Rhizobium sp. rho-13.1]TQY15522.1 O-antigen ligase family protein [Rhizobium sp. rho-1.1]
MTQAYMAEDVYTPVSMKERDLPVLVRLGLVVLLVLCLIQFSGAWYWGGVDLTQEDLEGVQPFGVPFRYGVWLSISIAIFYYFTSHSYKAVGTALMPFLPFVGMGMISGIQGYSFINSFRIEIFWLLMALSGTIIGLLLPANLMARVMSLYLTVILILSIVLVIAVPKAGTEVYGGASVWKGAFQQKNYLGALAMWAAVFAFFFSKAVGRWKSLLLFLVAAICLVGSDSKGSLAVAFAAIGYYVLLMSMSRSRLSPFIGSAALIGTVLLLAVGVYFLWVPITGAFGRDATLTGRTDIWMAYLARVVDHWFLGQGPGAFTSVSPVTEDLFYQLAALGSIRQPHNIFIAVVGDGGVVGLFLFVSALFYVAFVLPFQKRTFEARLCAIGAFLIIVGGMVEGRVGYNASLDSFFLSLLLAARVRAERAVLRRQRQSQVATDEDALLAP